jgi:hypothetical protein
VEVKNAVLIVFMVDVNELNVAPIREEPERCRKILRPTVST